MSVRQNGVERRLPLPPRQVPAPFTIACTYARSSLHAICRRHRSRHSFLHCSDSCCPHRAPYAASTQLEPRTLRLRRVWEPRLDFILGRRVGNRKSFPDSVASRYSRISRAVIRSSLVRVTYWDAFIFLCFRDVDYRLTTVTSLLLWQF